MNELVRWDPFQAIAPFESLLDIPTLLRPMRAASAVAGPRMDVAESDDAYQLAVELPGVSKEAIQVSVYDNAVTVSAELSAPEQEGAQWLLRERGYGKFSRTVSLPEAVDDEASQARYSDGVLTLTLKKKSASRQKRLAIH